MVLAFPRPGLRPSILLKSLFPFSPSYLWRLHVRLRRMHPTIPSPCAASIKTTSDVLAARPLDADASPNVIAGHLGKRWRAGDSIFTAELSKRASQSFLLCLELSSCMVTWEQSNSCVYLRAQFPGDWKNLKGGAWQGPSCESRKT